MHQVQYRFGQTAMQPSSFQLQELLDDLCAMARSSSTEVALRIDKPSRTIIVISRDLAFLIALPASQRDFDKSAPAIAPDDALDESGEHMAHSED